ncbi:MAG: hypothetical protein MJ094_02165 [Saccharofermentans sp.]|nr:hypothetical protein [Saccharofermentans sp.]
MKNQTLLIRKIVVYTIYILVFTTFQVTFRGLFSLQGLYPDLMFVFVVLTAYMFGFKDGMIVGSLVGVLRDYFAGPSITGIDGTVTATTGIGLLVMILAASYGSSFFTIRIKRNFPMAFSSVVTATLFYKIIGHLVVFTWENAFLHHEYNIGLENALMFSILPQTLLNMIIAIPVYLALRFIGPYHKGVNPALIDEKSREDNLWLTM